jgi:hypothetical protein
MRRYNEVTIRKANCNGVLIELQKVWARGDAEEDAYYLLYIVDQFDDWGGDQDPYDYETEAEGIAAFEGFVEEYRNKPNWNAQAAYDAEHGTINGEDAGIVEMRELWGG